MVKRTLWMICGVCLVLTARSGFCLEFTPEAMIDYGNALAARGEYKSAAEEYFRVITYFPEKRGDKDLVATMLKLAEKSEDYHFAIRLSRHIETAKYDPEIQCLGKYYFGRSLYYMKDYSVAVQVLNLPTICQKGIAWEGQFYRGLGFMHMQHWQNALQEFESIGVGFRFNNNKAAAIEAARNGKNLRFKSAKLSGIMSLFIPGSGYLYSGSPKSGIASLATVGLLYWGAFSAFQKDSDGPGTVLSILGVGWHIGGVYGSTRAAERFNEYVSKQYIDNLEIP